MKSIFRGAIAGTFATILMSVPVFAAQRLNVLQRPPPREISREVGQSTPLLPDAGSPAFPMMWPLAHLAYGAAGGVVYSLVQPHVPGSTVPVGLVYGGIVWAGGYAGFLPVLNLYPSPKEDSKPRLATMLIAHFIYGVTIAVVMKRFESGRMTFLNGR